MLNLNMQSTLICIFLLQTVAHAALWPSPNPGKKPVEAQFPEVDDSTLLEVKSFVVKVNSEGPAFTYWSGPCSSATNCTNFMVGALTNVYELNSTGSAIADRDANNVLNLTAPVVWTLGGDENVASANISLPLSSTPPACPVGSSLTPAPPAKGSAVQLQLVLAKKSQNITMEGMTTPVELLEGNIKWNVVVDEWPFCEPDNSLAIEFLIRTPTLNQTSSPEILTSEELEEDLKTSESILLGEEEDSEEEEESDDAQSPATSLSALLGKRNGNSNGNGNGNNSNNNGPKNVTRKFEKPQDAIQGRDLSPVQRDLLKERFVDRRPVKGLGRRNLTDPSTFVFLPPAADGKQVKLEAPGQAIVGNKLTNVTVELKGDTTNKDNDDDVTSGVMTIVVPAFEDTMTYDPFATIATDEATLANEVADAINGTIIEVPAPAPGPNAAPAPAPSAGEVTRWGVAVVVAAALGAVIAA